ncbi:MAG TPA: hypothetical protein VHM02_06920, partial [Thermoanaerobaculia bacterium]|nr:hypothetical protein [Thermoanaerobaculia bacterium]
MVTAAASPPRHHRHLHLAPLLDELETEHLDRRDHRVGVEGVPDQLDAISAGEVGFVDHRAAELFLDRLGQLRHARPVGEQRSRLDLEPAAERPPTPQPGRYRPFASAVRHAQHQCLGLPHLSPHLEPELGLEHRPPERQHRVAAVASDDEVEPAGERVAGGLDPGGGQLPEEGDEVFEPHVGGDELAGSLGDRGPATPRRPQPHLLATGGRR